MELETLNCQLNQPIRILIADDHPIFRRGLRESLETDASLVVVAEAENGAEALDLLHSLDVHIAVLDIDMPVKDGFVVARTLAERQSEVAVIFLTMHQDEYFFRAALEAGVKGYVLKDSAVLEIINCIKTVAAGKHYLSPRLSTFLVPRTETQAASTKLTPTETKIIKLIAQYKTSKEIADLLCVSQRTVENHRARISDKLNLKGSHALLKFALEHQEQI